MGPDLWFVDQVPCALERAKHARSSDCMRIAAALGLHNANEHDYYSAPASGGEGAAPDVGASIAFVAERFAIMICCSLIFSVMAST